MRIVVDTNIVFSALLNSNSAIAQIIFYPGSFLKFYSTDKLLNELDKHREKLITLSGFSTEELDQLINLISRKIRFINIRLIPKEMFIKAEQLTCDVDIDDCEFVALAEYIQGRLWSGDKKLIKGLLRKNWNKFIGVEELYQQIIKR